MVTLLILAKLAALTTPLVTLYWLLLRNIGRAERADQAELKLVRARESAADPARFTEGWEAARREEERRQALLPKVTPF